MKIRSSSEEQLVIKTLLEFIGQADHTAGEIAYHSGIDIPKIKELLGIFEEEGLVGSYVAGRARKKYFFIKEGKKLSERADKLGLSRDL